jgi:hypothetical protein
MMHIQQQPFALFRMGRPMQMALLVSINGILPTVCWRLCVITNGYLSVSFHEKNKPRRDGASLPPKFEYDL